MGLLGALLPGLTLAIIGLIWSQTAKEALRDGHALAASIFSPHFDCCGFDTLSLISTSSPSTDPPISSSAATPTAAASTINDPNHVDMPKMDHAMEESLRILHQTGALTLLDQKIEIYLPTTICPTPKEECAVCASLGCFVANEADIQSLKNHTLTLLAGWFGGANSFEIEGAWMSEATGSLIYEKNVICRSFTSPEAIGRNIKDVLVYIQLLGRELGQEAMAFELNGKLHLLKPTHSLYVSPFST